MSKKAIIEYDGRQFTCAEGDVITVGRLAEKVGATVTMDRVLACIDDEGVVVGAPVEGATVRATIEGHQRLPKVVTRKYRRRKGSRSQYAHRQPVTQLRITAITAIAAS